MSVAGLAPSSTQRVTRSVDDPAPAGKGAHRPRKFPIDGVAKRPARHVRPPADKVAMLLSSNEIAFSMSERTACSAE
jgi:hypothetical protein